MTVRPEHFQRGAIAKESTFKVAGAYTQMRGLKRGATITPKREMLPIEAALNSKGDRYAAIQGAQTYEGTFELYLHAAWYTDYADVFQAVFGVKDVVANPTFSSSADNFTVTTTTLAAAAIIKVKSNETPAKEYIVPVTVDAAGVLTLGIGIAATFVAVTPVTNPGGATGACFDYGAVGAAADTFSIETDWSALPSSTTQRNVLAVGCGITSFVLNYTRAAPLTITAKFIAAGFSDDGGAAANVSDPSAWTAEGPSWTGDFFLTTSSVLTWASTKTKVKTFSLELAPPLVVERSSNGLDGGALASGSSTLPSSDIHGYTRDAGFEGLFKIRVGWDATWIAIFAAQTVTHFFGVLYPGVPAGTVGTPRTAISIWRLIPQGTPTDVNEDGGTYMDLEFAVERDRTTNTNQERVHFARFNT